MKQKMRKPKNMPRNKEDLALEVRACVSCAGGQQLALVPAATRLINSKHYASVMCAECMRCTHAPPPATSRRPRNLLLAAAIHVRGRRRRALAAAAGDKCLHACACLYCYLL